MASISDKAYLVNAFDIRRNNYIGSLHLAGDCEAIEQYVYTLCWMLLKKCI